MKRDMELVRKILLEIEEKHCGNSIGNVAIDGYEQHIVNHHLKLLSQAGYISGTETIGSFLAKNLTWDGHEFLNTIRDPEVWRETKSIAAKVGSYSIKALTEIATSVISARINAGV